METLCGRTGSIREVLGANGALWVQLMPLCTNMGGSQPTQQLEEPALLL